MRVKALGRGRRCKTCTRGRWPRPCRPPSRKGRTRRGRRRSRMAGSDWRTLAANCWGPCRGRPTARPPRIRSVVRRAARGHQCSCSVSALGGTPTASRRVLPADHERLPAQPDVDDRPLGLARHPPRLDERGHRHPLQVENRVADSHVSRHEVPSAAAAAFTSYPRLARTPPSLILRAGRNKTLGTSPGCDHRPRRNPVPRAVGGTLGDFRHPARTTTPEAFPGRSCVKSGGGATRPGPGFSCAGGYHPRP